MSRNTDPFEPKTERKKPASDHYLIHNVHYPRVTSILGIAPGEHLMPWYAKEASVRAADLAHQALGEDPDDTVVLEHRSKRAPVPESSPTSREDALRRLTRWAETMREAERFRDYRAHIGSVMHHAAYDRVFDSRPPGEYEIEYLTALARRTSEYSEEAIERFEGLGVDIYKNVAFAAQPYVHAVWRFLDTTQPTFLMNGTETCVFNTQEVYAGTADFIAVFDEKRWSDAGFGSLGGDGGARILGDWKSSKSISKSVLYQLAAYARAEYVHLPDESDHPLPSVHGVMALHVAPNAERPVQPHIWWDRPGPSGTSPVDDAFEAFAALNLYFRHVNDQPRADRSRAARPPKPEKVPVGSRPCPF